MITDDPDFPRGSYALFKIKGRKKSIVTIIKAIKGRDTMRILAPWGKVITGKKEHFTVVTKEDIPELFI